MRLGLTEEKRFPARAGLHVLTMVAGVLALAVAACATIEAPAPANVAPAVGETHLAPPGNPERKRLIEAFGGEYHAPATETYLNGVLVRLAPASDGARAPLSRHRAQFADRQRLRPAFGGYFCHAGASGARRRHVGDRGGHGA